MTARLHASINGANRRWWTLGAMCFALFMVMLDNTVVNVALPSIQRDLDASISGLEWTVNAYTLSFAVLLVTGGRLGDLFGRRRMFLFGVVMFAASSAFIGLSPNATWLVAGRALQGVGAAFMMPGTLSIISNTFPPEERGKAIGTWAGVSALALAVGPVVGGFLVEHVSWQSIFFLNLPVAALAVVVTLFAAHESRDESAPRTVDVPGLVTITTGLTALVLALVQGNGWGWDSPAILGLFALAAVSLMAFVLVEQRHPAPMVDFTFFRSRSFLGAKTSDNGRIDPRRIAMSRPSGERLPSNELPVMRAAADGGDPDPAHRAAHTLKGLGATFGATGLARLCQRAESHPADMAGVVAQIAAEHERVAQALRGVR